MAKRTARSRTSDAPSSTANDSAVATPETQQQEDTGRSESRDDAPMGRDDLENSSMRSESMSSEPNEHDIRLRAYQRYLERGGGHGLEFDDWVEAERELKGRK